MERSLDDLAVGSGARSLSDTELEAWRATLRRWLDRQPPVPSRGDRNLRLLAKSANGIALGPAEQAALDHWGHAEAAYGAVFKLGRAPDVGCTVLKGPAIAALYPRGWVRSSADLDLHAPSEDALWKVSRALRDDGWRLAEAAAIATPVGSRLSFSFGRACPHCDHHLGVELLGVGFFGDPVRTEPLASLAVDSRVAASAQVAPLLEEAFQRPFHLRDVFDLWLLTHVLPHSPAVAWQVVDEVGLWPEYRQIVAVAERHGAPAAPVPADLRSRVGAARRSRRRRQLAVMRRRSGWAYVGGRLLRRVRADRPRELGSRAVLRLSSPAAVYAAGLPVCGLCLDDEAGELTIETTGGRLRARTPLGGFEFTHAPDLIVYDDDL